jgi:NarL family two-component system response regulator LiaR
MRTIGIISRRPLFSHALSALISIHHDAETVWEIQGASELRAVPLEKRAVDVVVIDVGSNVVDRVAVASVREQQPDARILLICDAPSDDVVLEALLAGAQGCLSQASDVKSVFAALQALKHGEVWADARITAAALSSALERRAAAHIKERDLSTREWEVLSVLATGKRNQAIADELCISVQTVKRHVYSIYRKLNVLSRLEASLLFYRLARERDLSLPHSQPVANG